MANGESYEKVLDRIEAHALRIEQKIDKINEKGCAQRPNDMLRIDNLEKWRDRGIIGTISLAASIAYTWLMKR